ncbi:MAG: hypothetical protein IPK13_24300 [Deltaproteobacteria bacterium]|nr:hypothetical protein [Deltaproteobacteria bacterium]
MAAEPIDERPVDERPVDESSGEEPPLDESSGDIASSAEPSSAEVVIGASAPYAREDEMRAEVRRPATYSTLPRRYMEFGGAFGVGADDLLSPSRKLKAGDDSAHGEHVSVLLHWSYAISDRLQWSVPTAAFAYRGGDPGGFEWIPYGGLTRWGIGTTSDQPFLFSGILKAGSDFKLWLGRHGGFVFGAAVGSPLRLSRRPEVLSSWGLRAQAGYMFTISERVSFGLGARYFQFFVAGGHWPTDGSEVEPVLTLGSVVALANRTFPLVRVHVTDLVSIDGYASASIDLHTGRMDRSLMLGSTFTW